MSLDDSKPDNKRPPVNFDFQKSIEAEISRKAIKPPESKKFDKQTSIEEETTRKLKIANDLEQTNVDLKKGICFWVKCVVSIYLAFIAVVVANIVFWKEGGLSDAVLIALLTTTTINILGLPLMIIFSLFPNKKKLQE
jgi:hypothetical protein